jgi:hypothetical protein
MRGSRVLRQGLEETYAANSPIRYLVLGICPNPAFLRLAK